MREPAGVVTKERELLVELGMKPPMEKGREPLSTHTINVSYSNEDCKEKIKELRT